MTQGLNPNFIEIDEFFDSLLDTGLYYELGDDLHKVFHENDLKKLRKDKSKMISARDTSKSSALEILE
jgi:cobalamin biosynthesis protein CobD/CbiB